MTQTAPSKPIQRGLWSDAWRRLKRNRNALAGLVIILSLIFLALLAPLLAPFNPLQGDLADHDLPPFWWPGASAPGGAPAADKPPQALMGPSSQGNFATVEIDLFGSDKEKPRIPKYWYFFGTDDLGRDVFSRIIHGSRYSLFIGLLSVSIGLGVGLFLGIVSGYFGGRLDELIMRAMDLLLAIPYVLLAILIVAILGAGLTNAMIAIGIVGIPQFARIMRGAVLSLKNTEYVQAARVLGAGHWGIIRKHILRNSLSPLIVQTTLSFASAILSAAALGFLGLGAQPPAPEWGVMLADGKKLMLTSPWAVIFPESRLSFLYWVQSFGRWAPGCAGCRMKD